MLPVLKKLSCDLLYAQVKGCEEHWVPKKEMVKLWHSEMPSLAVDQLPAVLYAGVRARYPEFHL